jgi:hypothetical protein
MEKKCEAAASAPDAGAMAAAHLDEVRAMLREVAQENAELEEIAGGSLTEALAEWVAAQYLFFVRKQLATLTDEAECLKLLQRTARDLVPLQRASRWAAKLKLEEEKLELEREQHKDAMAKAEAKRQAAAQDCGPLTMAEHRAIVDKVDDVLGLKTRPRQLPVDPNPKGEAGKSEGKRNVRRTMEGEIIFDNRDEEGNGVVEYSLEGLEDERRLQELAVQRNAKILGVVLPPGGWQDDLPAGGTKPIPEPESEEDGGGNECGIRNAECGMPQEVARVEPVAPQKVEGVPEWAQTFGF